MKKVLSIVMLTVAVSVLCFDAHALKLGSDMAANKVLIDEAINSYMAKNRSLKADIEELTKANETNQSRLALTVDSLMLSSEALLAASALKLAKTQKMRAFGGHMKSFANRITPNRVSRMASKMGRVCAPAAPYGLLGLMGGSVVAQHYLFFDYFAKNNLNVLFDHDFYSVEERIFLKRCLENRDPNKEGVFEVYNIKDLNTAIETFEATTQKLIRQKEAALDKLAFVNSDTGAIKAYVFRIPLTQKYLEQQVAIYLFEYIANQTIIAGMLKLRAMVVRKGKLPKDSKTRAGVVNAADQTQHLLDQYGGYTIRNEYCMRCHPEMSIVEQEFRKSVHYGAASCSDCHEWRPENLKQYSYQGLVHVTTSAESRQADFAVDSKTRIALAQSEIQRFIDEGCVTCMKCHGNLNAEDQTIAKTFWRTHKVEDQTVCFNCHYEERMAHFKLKGLRALPEFKIPKVKRRQELERQRPEGPDYKFASEEREFYVPEED